MARSFFNISLFLLLLPCPAWAADGPPPVEFKGLYELAFAGIPFGKMGFEADVAADHYALTSDVTLTGLIRIFVQHTSHTVATAKTGDIHYEAHYKTRKKPHYIRMEFKHGLLREEEQVPPETHETRPEVPLKLRQSASDPISAALKMRQGVWAARKSGKPDFHINVYDGNRLTEADFHVEGKTTLYYNGAQTPMIKVSLRRKLLAGFTPKELGDWDPKEPVVAIYFTDDQRMIPIRVEIPLTFGPITAILTKECSAGESCLLGMRD